MTMKIDFITLLTLVYILLNVWAVMMWYKQHKKYNSSAISGIILLAYSTWLHLTNRLTNNWIILICAVVLLTLSAFDYEKERGKINWAHHAIRLVTHGIIVYFMIFS